MRGIVPLAIILIALGVLLVTHGRENVAGLSPDQLASFAWMAAVGIVILGSVLSLFRGRLGAAVEALAFWAAMILMLVALYTYRDDLAGVAGRVVGELVPGTVRTLDGGRQIALSRIGTHFEIRGSVNGTPTRFLVDTGASTVVLTSATALKAGFDPAGLVYSQVVATANGRVLAAPVVIDRLVVGTLTEEKVRALVVRDKGLSGDLLGMSFLDRLESYEVRDGTMYMRQKGAARGPSS